jgi:hypothetical protein
MMTLIWLACVLTTWTPASGLVAGYHTETRALNEGWVRGPDVEFQYVVCVPEKYVPTEFRVRGFDAAGAAGEWSNPLHLKRVHDFDGAENDGVVGFADFGKFISAFGYQHLPSGRVVTKPSP